VREETERETDRDKYRCREGHRNMRGRKTGGQQYRNTGTGSGYFKTQVPLPVPGTDTQLVTQVRKG
jgi:hypothetical protein